MINLFFPLVTATNQLPLRCIPLEHFTQRTILLERNPLHLANRPLLAFPNRVPLSPTPRGALLYSLTLPRTWTGVLGWWGRLLPVRLPACAFGHWCDRNGGWGEGEGE